MQRKRLYLAAGAVIAAGAVAATAIAATGMDDNEQPITGEALQKASDAALAYTGAGRVTETEVGDEDSYYEVEVTMPDGHQVDVQLDKEFNVVSDSVDTESDSSDN